MSRPWTPDWRVSPVGCCRRCPAVATWGTGSSRYRIPSKWDGAWRCLPAVIIRRRLPNVGKGRKDPLVVLQPRSAPKGDRNHQNQPWWYPARESSEPEKASQRPGILTNIAQALSATRNGSTGRDAELRPCVSRVRKVKCPSGRDGLGRQVTVLGCPSVDAIISSVRARGIESVGMRHGSPYPSSHSEVPSRLPVTVAGDWSQDIHLH